MAGHAEFGEVEFGMGVIAREWGGGAVALRFGDFDLVEVENDSLVVFACVIGELAGLDDIEVTPPIFFVALIPDRSIVRGRTGRQGSTIIHLGSLGCTPGRQPNSRRNRLFGRRLGIIRRR